MESNSVYLAVYGTLKVDERNYPLYLAPIRPIYQGKLNLNYQLYSNTDYPMLVPSKSPHSIVLEVFEISHTILEKIDGLEEPYEYHREQISLNIDGKTHSVEIYVYNHPIPPKGFHLLDHGEFKNGI
ncbi:MAG: gamma-glutamylcyclotransferase [Candidatus Heimdallarchaeota archaeon]|nr:gamma-glutamylcyclotransferase [Candidatus Heimdallarchaeota archaeon]